MIQKLLDMQRYIFLADHETTQHYIKEPHGVSCHFLMCIYDIKLLQHALTAIHIYLYAHAHQVGILSLTAARLGLRSPLSYLFALARNALMLVRGGELSMSLL